MRLSVLQLTLPIAVRFHDLFEFGQRGLQISGPLPLAGVFDDAHFGQCGLKERHRERTIDLQQLPYIGACFPELSGLIRILMKIVRLVQRGIGDLPPGLWSQVGSSGYDSTHARILEKMGFITVIDLELKASSYRLLVIVRPFDGPQKDQTLNLVEACQSLENRSANIVPLEGSVQLRDEPGVIVKHPRFLDQGREVPVMKVQTAVAVVVQGGVYPEDGTLVSSRRRPLPEQKKGLSRACLRILSHPDKERHPSADDHHAFVEKIFPLKGAEVDPVAQVGTCDEDGMDMGQDPVQEPPEAATVDFAAWLKRGEEVYDETSQSS